MVKSGFNGAQLQRLLFLPLVIFVLLLNFYRWKSALSSLLVWIDFLLSFFHPLSVIWLWGAWGQWSDPLFLFAWLWSWSGVREPTTDRVNSVEPDFLLSSVRWERYRVAPRSPTFWWIWLFQGTLQRALALTTLPLVLVIALRSSSADRAMPRSYLWVVVDQNMAIDISIV